MGREAKQPHDNKASLRIKTKQKKHLKNDLVCITDLGEYVTQIDPIGGEFVQVYIKKAYIQFFGELLSWT